ncbi:glycosyltransferase [Deinococcus oregonensis]|uniref:Glycosyltransferase n=1 Tax=Deinococcus oregonensis TaxID=1805970 RepID=A0ABV6AVM7_9DEIO
MAYGTSSTRATSAGLDPGKTTHTVLEALKLAGLRGVLATGWGGLRAEETPESVYVLESVPHEWLFPRMSAVTHHGGAGTTAAGLTAGTPTVICPFSADQPFWGRVVHQLGVGTTPVPQKTLRADQLAAALRQATQDAAMRQRAQALGRRLQTEDGVGAAVRWVETNLAGRQINADQHRF